jgi:hypothetical protein
MCSGRCCADGVAVRTVTRSTTSQLRPQHPQRHTHCDRIARPESVATRMRANSQSMASGYLTITHSRVGSLRAGRRRDHYAQLLMFLAAITLALSAIGSAFADGSGMANESRPESSLCKRPHLIHVAIAVSAPAVADHIHVGATPDI